MIGIVIGCIIGVIIPKMIISNSTNQGLNKVASHAVFLGHMEEDELLAIMEDKIPVGTFRA